MAITYGLVGIDDVQTYVGSLYKSSEIALWEMLVNQATAIIEKYLHRRIASRSYSREAYSGTGAQTLILKEWPVSKVSRVSIGRTNVFSIKNTGATTYATFEVTSTLIRFNVDGTESTLTLASYANLTALVAAINAVSGWTASLLSTSFGTLKPTNLLVMPGVSAMSPDAAFAQIPDEDAVEFYLVASDEGRNAGIIKTPGAFPAGVENIFVDYTAGYSTIPEELKAACLGVVRALYERSKKDPTLASESLGDYSYSNLSGKDADILEPHRVYLDYHRRPPRF
jgi:hypothetical protein